MGAITAHSHRGYDEFVGGITLLFVLCAAGLYVLRGSNDRKLLPWILGSAAVFVVTLALVYPITAIDIFAYIDQSRIMLHYHANPIFVPPASFATDPLMPLSDGWSGAGSPYGPLGLIIDALPMPFAGANLLANLILLKLMFGGMVVSSGFVIYRILLRVSPRHALGGALLGAWNPLILFEGVANGHNDVAMMLFALLGLLSLVEGDLVLGIILLVAACLIKFATIILMPLFLVYALNRLPTSAARARFLALASSLAAFVAVFAYSRFWQGPDTLAHVLSQNQRYLDSFSSVVTNVTHSIAPDRSAVIGRILFGFLYAFALFLSARGTAGLLRGCFLATFGFVALALTNVESWYGIWIVLLAAAVPFTAERAGSLFFAWGASLGAAFFGYEWVWRGLSNPQAYAYVNNKTYLLSFVPTAVVLVVFSDDRARSWTARSAATRIRHVRQGGAADAVDARR
ncbi:MAG: hypothetical protein DLM70_05205 [Chloroflexi bacterium]|nr:MAG: hypothetical protein DLM70_05205 [Chloroflexota bacterium]